jgi:hypothetical protein
MRNGRKSNILAEYDRLGRRAKLIEERRQSIRREIEAAGGKLEEDGWIGLIKEQRRQQMAGVKECEEKLGRKFLEEHELVREISFTTLTVTRFERKKAS